MEYDRASELFWFDQTKSGVKGLVDAGIDRVPRIFHHPRRDEAKVGYNGDDQLQLPIIDMAGIGTDPARRKDAIEKVREGLQSWGFFQVVNHGIPAAHLDGVIEAVRTFHEDDDEKKRRLYSRETSKGLVFTSNFSLFKSPAADWRDTVFCDLATMPTPEQQPLREILTEHCREVKTLALILLELLSEALGLGPSHLSQIGCAEGMTVSGNYYPACPQPEVTIGVTPHTDKCFITVLVQDGTGGLQVLRQNQWVDLAPTPGALVVNAGDLLQSVQHRVLVNTVGPRLSVAVFFQDGESGRVYGPIQELLSEEFPAKYRNTTAKEFIDYFKTRGLDHGTPCLAHFEV